MTRFLPRFPIFLLLLSLLPLSSAGEEKPVLTEGQKKLPLPGESFRLNGKDAFVILPAKSIKPVPWVWYAPTLPGLPSQAEVWMFRQFLEAGIAIAGIDVGESYGSPMGRQAYSQLHRHLTEARHFHSRPCLLARSRGGLMLYNWAVEHPEKVAGIAGIYPVCNLESYPGLAKAAGAYQLTPEDLKKQLKEHNPIERLAPLAKAGVPVFHLHGDSDRVVPHADNTALLARRYRELGGPVKVTLFEGQGHNMWKGWFESQPLCDFVMARALHPETPVTWNE
jgi:pimeloyl-ACP methyl ester carboxylesterase